MSTFDNQSGGFFSQGGQSSQRKETVASIRPVTIKQINESSEPLPDSDTHIDGAPLGKASIVAQVRSVAANMGNFMYRVEDGTGSLEFKVWLDKHGRRGGGDDMDVDAGEDESEFKPNDYVSVVGSVRVFNGKNSFNVNKIRKVEDFNEITCHIAKCIAAHLHFTKGSQDSAAASNANGNTAAANTNTGGSELFVAGAALSNNVQQQIFAVLKNGPQDTGTHVEEISRKLNMKLADIMREVEEMEGNGACYQGEDNHYLPVE
ncbi:hypothetical protein TRVA0_001S08702 [Trichomonascus vanleenenianus]|uniref:Rfa2p n=1 Tax=Trichomonascus vanleenenianus TaxID=2268995 RepID=UPI003ECAFFFB